MSDVLIKLTAIFNPDVLEISPANREETALRVLVGTEFALLEAGREEVNTEEEVCAADVVHTPPAVALAVGVCVEETMVVALFTLECEVEIKSTVVVHGVVTGGIPLPTQLLLPEVDGHVWIDWVVTQGWDVRGVEIDVVTGERVCSSVSVFSIAKNASRDFNDRALPAVVVVDLAVEAVVIIGP